MDKENVKEYAKLLVSFSLSLSFIRIFYFTFIRCKLHNDDEKDENECMCEYFRFLVHFHLRSVQLSPVRFENFHFLRCVCIGFSSAWNFHENFLILSHMRPHSSECCCCSCWASFVCTIYQLKFKIMFSVDKRRIENLIAMLAIPSWTINICIKIFFEETIMSKFVTCPAFTRPLFPFNCLKIFIFRLYTA